MSRWIRQSNKRFKCAK
ncbi:hypothetical protein OB980_06305 [Bacillus cereus]|nr:hypothetical protein [Bacillus cereus]MCU5010322.1 hypothetical protein [Bacillus cereus]